MKKKLKAKFLPNHYLKITFSSSTI